MSLPVYLHSGMTGAPQATFANGTITSLFTTCLVNGFNTQNVVSATAASGVVTFNFASAPGFSALDTVTIAGASNSTVNGKFRVQSAASNQVLVAIPGVPDGAVGGTITLKFSPLGWTRPYSGTNIAAYRQGGTAVHKRFLRVRDSAYTTDNGGARFRARGYENMTAISTGTGAFPTTAQITGEGCEFLGPQAAGLTANVDPRPWVLVGTPRAFYFSVAHYFDNGGDPALGLQNPKDVFAAIAGGGALFFFGEMANIIKPGDTYAYGIGSGYGYPLGFNNNLYLPRAVAGSGTAVIGSAYGGMGGNQALFGGNYPNPSNGGINLGPPMLVHDLATYSLRGELPGMLSLFEYCSQGGLKVGHIFDTINGVTGRVVLMSGVGLSAGTEFFLRLDEDWGDV